MEKNMKDQNKDKDKETQEKKGNEREAEKQEQPLKKHGVPEDPEEARIGGGLKGAKNFNRNMGCGG